MNWKCGDRYHDFCFRVRIYSKWMKHHHHSALVYNSMYSDFVLYDNSNDSVIRNYSVIAVSYVIITHCQGVIFQTYLLILNQLCWLRMWWCILIFRKGTLHFWHVFGIGCLSALNGKRIVLTLKYVFVNMHLNAL